MPIIRTYGCPECGHMIEVTLQAEEWDAPPPECPSCITTDMEQEFRAPGIIGSIRARAVATAERIADEDYRVADMHLRDRKVRFKNAVPSDVPSAGWSNVDLAAAIAAGRKTRSEGPTGLEILHEGLRRGTIPDIIANSKRRSGRIW